MMLVPTPAQVWEGGLAAPAAGAAGAAGVNPWSASSDDDDDEQEALSAAARRRSSLGAPRGRAWRPLSPCMPGACHHAVLPPSLAAACWTHALTCVPPLPGPTLAPASCPHPRLSLGAEAGSSGARPGPQAPLPDKERWITAKYVDKRFLARPQGGAAAPPRLQEWLWEAVAAGDVRAGARGRPGGRQSCVSCGWRALPRRSEGQ